MQVSAQQDTPDNDVIVKPFADILFGMLIHTRKKRHLNLSMAGQWDHLFLVHLMIFSRQ